jgi:hypothetical protein
MKSDTQEQGHSSMSENLNSADGNRRSWEALKLEEQTALLDAYGHWLDHLPPTCSMEVKTARFRAWLDARGIDFEQNR